MWDIEYNMWKKEIDATNIKTLDLGVRINNAFERNKIKTLGDLRNGFPENFLNMNGLGRKSLYIFRKKISKLDENVRIIKPYKWFRIEGISGYFISDNNEIWSIGGQRILKQYQSKNGPYVILNIDGHRTTRYISYLSENRKVEP